MANYPVVTAIQDSDMQVVEYVDSNEYYICTADSPNRLSTDAFWRICKVTNSNNGEYPYRQVVVFANGTKEYIFRQVDFNNSSVITYPIV